MSQREEMKRFVSGKIRFLQAQANTGEGKALLANLRRGVGREPGEMPQNFGMLLLDMPEAFMSRSGKITEQEWACYTALTLYALHQQGFEVQSKSMHTDEKDSVGRALYRLAEKQEDSNGEKRSLQKLQTLVTSIDRKEMAYHLKGLVQILKREEIPLNYVLLSADLLEFQKPDGKNCVALRWGQDFYRKRNKEKEEMQ